MTSRKVLLLIAGAGIVAMLWKEFPAMLSYYKIERMRRNRRWAYHRLPISPSSPSPEFTRRSGDRVRGRCSGYAVTKGRRSEEERRGDGHQGRGRDLVPGGGT